MSAARFAKIVGTGSALPRNVVSNAALAEKLAAQGVETSDSWIVERTGIRQRHIAALEVTSSELGTQAALAALQAAGMQAKDIDLIICATSTPDFVFPSAACLIQAKLGVAGGAAFDVQAVCSGFAYAMATADAYIRTGLANNALVIGSEVFSRILDWNDRTTCVLADGSQQHILRTAGNVCSGAIVGHPFLTMDGQAVFKLAVRVLDEVAREVVTAAGMQLEQIDWLIPHQANVRILSATAKKLGLPESKTIVTVDQHANTSAASIPLALDLAVRDGRIRPGHHVLMEGVGGGFTWGAVLARM